MRFYWNFSFNTVLGEPRRPKKAEFLYNLMIQYIDKSVVLGGGCKPQTEVEKEGDILMWCRGKSKVAYLCYHSRNVALITQEEPYISGFKFSTHGNSTHGNRRKRQINRNTGY